MVQKGLPNCPNTIRAEVSTKDIRRILNNRVIRPKHKEHQQELLWSRASMPSVSISSPFALLLNPGSVSLRIPTPLNVTEVKYEESDHRIRCGLVEKRHSPVFQALEHRIRTIAFNYHLRRCERFPFVIANPNS